MEIVREPLGDAMDVIASNGCGKRAEERFL
jgi:hypothetical protein